MTVKDLRHISDKLESIVLIDNSISSFSRQLSNGIWIKSFYGDIHDAELLYLCKYLMTLNDCANVPEKLRKDFRYEYLYNYFCNNW